jgi:hypothetical protein
MAGPDFALRDNFQIIQAVIGFVTDPLRHAGDKSLA